MSDRKHVREWFHPLEPEDIAWARTITIRLKDGSEADVDDDRNWYADDESVFEKAPEPASGRGETGGGGRPARFCQEQTHVLAEQVWHRRAVRWGFIG